MPDVRVTTTSEFDQKINEPEFYSGVRKIVADAFGFDLSKVGVKCDGYAPGCDDERPPVTVLVSVGEGNRAPMHAEIAQTIADGVKSLSDSSFGTDVGQIKVILDLCLRKVAVAGDLKTEEGKWKLEGYDTFSDEPYALSGEYGSQEEAEAAAEKRLEELEETQPSESSGGQDGIQDGVYVIKPDGSKYLFTLKNS